VISAVATPSGQPDAELMGLIESGSIVAFECLYDRYSHRAYRVALSVCRERGRAEEAVQDAFIAIWRNKTPYRPERGAVAAWLLSSVRYRAIDTARRHHTHIKRRADESSINADRFAADPDERAVADVEAAHLHTLLNQLPDAQREVITLAFYGQLTHTEIATRLQLPTGTVKGRMRLGLEKLRVKVEQAA
jgi:RNA polymerase sigma-70 factor, ECF subfamily